MISSAALRPGEAYELDGAQLTIGRGANNDVPLEELLAAFRAARLRFVRGLEALPEDELAVSALHPRMRVPMRVIDMALFVAEHDDHHLATITELSGGSAERT